MVSNMAAKFSENRKFDRGMLKNPGKDWFQSIWTWYVCGPLNSLWEILWTFDEHLVQTIYLFTGII